MPRLNPLEGKRFGKLLVLSRWGKSNNNGSLWLCKCDCGNIHFARTNHLRIHNTMSCGCAKVREVDREYDKNVDAVSKRLYNIWHGMLRRCFDQNRPDYHLYGGRGISVCAEWATDFKAFKAWAMAEGYENDLTIDRVDVNGNYEPSNCRWATWKEQAHNKRISA